MAVQCSRQVVTLPHGKTLRETNRQLSDQGRRLGRTNTINWVGDQFFLGLWGSQSQVGKMETKRNKKEKTKNVRQHLC
jgi:hypothetical protein